MAKKTQTELLEGILLLLDQSLGEIKKKNKEAGVSNAPKGAGIVNAKDISVKAVGDALSVISSAVPKLAKISEKQYDTVAKGIEKLASAISSFKMDKDSLAAIGNTISAFVQIHNVILGMSENFIKSILSLNPIKAWVLGKRLGKFYGILAQGMVGTFVKQIINIINQVPPNKNVNSKIFKERLDNFGLMMQALLQIKEKQIMQLQMMGIFLGPKIGASIGGFFKELIDKLAGGKNSIEKANAAAKVASSLAALVGTLTLSLIALVILWKTNDIKDVLGGFGLLTMVVAFALGIIKLLDSKWFKQGKNEGLKETKDILLLIGGLTLATVALVLVAKNTKLNDVAQGIMMLTTVVAFALGILLVLKKESFKKNISDGLKSLEKITLLIGALTLTVVALVLVAKNTKWTDVAQGIMMLTSVMAFATGILLVLKKESFKKNISDGLKSIEKIMLLIGGLTVSTIALVLVAKNTKLSDVAQGILMLTTVMTFATGILLVLRKENFKKNASEGLKSLEKITLLIGGLTLALTIVTLVAKNTKLSVVAQGIMMLGAVVAFALGTLLILGNGSFKKNASEGLKSLEKITLLIGGLTLATIALVLVAKNTKWTDAVQGIMMLGAVVAFALGTLIVFRKQNFKKNASEGLKSLEKITLLIGGLTLALTIVTLVAKNTKWTDVAQGIMMLTTIVAFTLGIAKLLGSKQFNQGKNEGLKGTKDILLLIGGLTLATVALVLVAKNTKWTDVAQGIMMLTTIVAFATGILLVLRKQNFKKNTSEGLKSLEKIMLLIGELTLGTIALVLVAKNTKWTDVAQGIMMLTTVVAFAIGIIKLLGSKWFKQGKNEGLKGTKDILLLIGGLTLSVVTLVLVAKNTKWTDVAQGMMMLGAIMAFAIGIIKLLDSKWFNQGKNEGLQGTKDVLLLIGGLVLSAIALVLVAKNNKWTDVAQGIMMLTTIIAFALGIIKLLNSKQFNQGKNEGLKGTKDILLLIGGLTLATVALVLVAKNTKWSDVIQGIMMLGSVVAIAIGIIKLLSSKQFNQGKNEGLSGVKTILLLIGGLTLATAALVLVAKSSKWSDVIQGILMLTAVTSFAIGIIKLLDSKWLNQGKNKDLHGTKDILLLIGGLTLATVALVLVAKNTKWTDVIQGIIMLTTITAFAIGIIKLLDSKWFNQGKNKGLSAVKTILLLIGGLTLATVALVLVAKNTKWTDIVQGILMLTTITAFALGIIKLLSSKQFNQGKNEGLKGTKDILLLIGGLTLSTAALVLVAKNTKWTDVIQGIIMLTTVMTFATGILLVLGKESFKKNVSDGLKSLEKIMLLIGGLTLALTVLVLVAKNTKWTDVAQGIMMLTTITAFTIGIVKLLSSKWFNQGKNEGLKGTKDILLLIGGLTLALTILTYIAKNTKLTDVVRGIIMLTVVMTFAGGIIKLLGSKQFNQGKNEGLQGTKDILLLIGGLTLALTILTYVAKNTKWTDVAQGIMMLTTITTFAISVLLVLGKGSFKKNVSDGLKSLEKIMLLIGGLTLATVALVLVAKNTKLTDVAQGIIMLTTVIAFALGITKLLGSKWFKQGKNEGLKGTKDILLLIGGLTLALTILTYVAKNTKLSDVAQGIIMLTTVMAFAIGIVKLLGSKWFNQGKNKGLSGVKTILLLIGGLTLATVALVLVAKNTKWTDVAQGIMLLTAVMAFAAGILLVLGKQSFKKNASEGLKSIEKIMLLIGGLTLSIAILTYVAKKTRWQDMVQGIIMLTTVVAFALGLIWILSRDSFQKNATKGLVGVGAIILLIAGVSAAMLIFAEYVKKIDGVKKESAWRAFGLMWAVIGGMAAFAAVIGAIWSTGIGAGVFAAAFVGVEMIAAMIASVSSAILLFVELIEKTKALSKADINTAYDRIIGKGANDTESLVGCLVSIVNAIDENIRWKAAPKIAAIGLAIRPLISSISQFVDVIQKMASMQIADQWDKNGNPIHYLKLTPSKFKDAAKNLTDAFSTFLKDLSEGLKGFDTSSLAIIQLLFPRQSGFSKLLTGEKPGIGLVIKTLSDFIDVIQKMASMSVPDKWDKYGKPISYKKLDPEKDFKLAAVNLSSAFSTFISELGKGLEDVSIKSAIVLKLLGGDISGVLQGIGAAFNPIIQIAAGKMQVGNQTVDITLPKLKQAAKDVVKVISTIITDLSAIKDKIDFDDFEGSFACVDRIIEMIGKIATSEAAKEDFPKKINEILMPGIRGIFNFLQSTEYIDKANSNANNFKDVIEDFADGIKELERIQMNLFNNEFIGHSTNLVNGLNEIVKYLNDTNFKAAKTKSSVFTDVIEDFADGIKELNRIQMNLFNNEFIGHSTNLVNGLNEIINFLQSTAYIDKAKSNANSFKDVIEDFADGIKELERIQMNLFNKDYSTNLVNGLNEIVKYLNDTNFKTAKTKSSVFKDVIEDFVDGIKELNRIQMNLFSKDYSTNLVNGLNEIFNFLLQSTKYLDNAKSNSVVFKDVIEDFIDGIKELERIQMNLFNKEFIDYSTNLVNGLNEIFNFLQSTKYLANAKSNSVVFKDVMKNTSAGINHIKPFLSSTPKQIVDLANAMKQLDAELITKEEQRTKAIQSVASNFKDMAEGVNQLNKAMAESMRLTRLYDQMKSVTSGNIIAKGVSAAVEGAGAVASKVKEALNDNKSEEQQKAKEETKQKDREELAAIIGNAVSAALTAWSESHRDLTVQFSDSPEKIFGEVYHN